MSSSIFPFPSLEVVVTHTSNSKHARASLFQTYMSKRSSGTLTYRHSMRVYVVLKGSNHAEIGILVVQVGTTVLPSLVALVNKSWIANKIPAYRQQSRYSFGNAKLRITCLLWQTRDYLSSLLWPVSDRVTAVVHYNFVQYDIVYQFFGAPKHQWISDKDRPATCRSLWKAEMRSSSCQAKEIAKCLQELQVDTLNS